MAPEICHPLLRQGLGSAAGVRPSRSHFPGPGPIDVDIDILIPLGQLQLEVLGQEVPKEALSPMLLSHLAGQVDGALGPTQMLEGPHQQWEGRFQIHDICPQHQVIVSRKAMLVNSPGQGTDLHPASRWYISTDIILDLL